MSYFKAREGPTNVVISKRPPTNTPTFNETLRRSPRTITKTYLEYSSDFDEDPDPVKGPDAKNQVGSSEEDQEGQEVQDQFVDEEIHETAENFEETVWEETNQTIEMVSPETPTVKQQTYNDKGKRTTPCRFCHNLFEEKTGIRMHQ